MSILAFLVARHCALSCFIVFYYYSCGQVANKLIEFVHISHRCRATSLIYIKSNLCVLFVRYAWQHF